MSLVREAAQVPDRTDLNMPDTFIQFRHPGYHEDVNVMLRLAMLDPISDPATGAAMGWGLYAGFALEACGIIAGNRFDGWFSESKDSSVAARVDATSVLHKNAYYFHLPLREGDEAGEPYGVVGSFREWRFTHDNLPGAWTRIETTRTPPPHRRYARLQLPETIRARDVTCRISGCEDGTRTAHLCPRTEGKWWLDNNMMRYTSRMDGGVDDTSNAILLRADLRVALDEADFVFVPKPSSTPEVSDLVIHLMGVQPQLHSIYHNRRLQSTPHFCIPSMFTRFAWSLFYEYTEPPFSKRVGPVPGASDGILEDSDGVSEASKGAPTSTETRSQSAKKRKLEPDTATGMSTAGPPGSATGAALSHAEDHASPPSFRDRENTGSDSAAADDSLRPVAREWLARERKRSDPEGCWKKEKEWARKVSRGNVTMNRKGRQRWYEISGVEVFDADEAGSPFREGEGSPVREMMDEEEVLAAKRDGSPVRQAAPADRETGKGTTFA